MATRMLAFILLPSQSGYTLLTRVAAAWQLGCGGAAALTSGVQAESSARVPEHRLSQGDSSALARGVLILCRSKTDTATRLHQHFVSKQTIYSDFALVRFSCA